MRTVPSVLTCCAWMIETSGVRAGRRTTSSSSWPKGSSMTMTFSQGTPSSQRSSGGKPVFSTTSVPRPDLLGMNGTPRAPARKRRLIMLLV